MSVYIGIDNGVTGSISFLGSSDLPVLFAMPVRKEMNYTKKVAQITRINYGVLYRQVSSELEQAWKYNKKVRVFIERPFVNPTGFRATCSAMRCLEAVQILCESLSLAYQFVDSREWQKTFHIKKSVDSGFNLKQQSVQIGKRLFPDLSITIDKIGDADALLMAEWARRNSL